MVVAPRAIALFAALILIIGIVGAATISGTAYEWYTFEPLKNILVEINSTPKQVIVAQTGEYSFEVSPGDYNIVAQYFEGNELKYEAREHFTVRADGNFTLDLVLFPALDEGDYILEDFNSLTLPPEQSANPPSNQAMGLGQVILVVLVVVAILATIVFGVRLLVRKTTGLETERLSVHEKLGRENEIMQKAINENQMQNASAVLLPQNLSADLREAIDVIKNYGGRITQKELREKLPQHGEAKVSLMVDELEDMGIVKKFRKGRGNILVLRQ